MARIGGNVASKWLALSGAVLVSALTLWAAPPASATSFGINGYPTSSGDPLYPSWTTLEGAHVGMSVLRTSVQWNAYDQAAPDGSCEPSGNTDEQNAFFEQFWAAANWYRRQPIVVINNGYWGANPPGGGDYYCGVIGIFQTINTWMTSWGLPDSEVVIEPFNEPDNSSGQCSTAPCFKATDAATLFMIAHNANSYGFQLLAGAFTGDPPQGSSTYITDYANFLHSYYGLYPTNWSFHDYGDIDGGDRCQTNGQYCDFGEVNTFWSDLQSVGIQPSIWITEAGYIGGHAPFWDAHAAEEWLMLGGYANAVLWYDLPGGEPVGKDGDGDDGYADSDGDNPWDSGLLNGSLSGAQQRKSLCVIAYNESPATAINDSRCPATN